MKAIGAWIGLALSLVGCAGQTGAPAIATPTGAQRPAWQQQMDEARRLAAAGSNYVMVVTPLKAEASGSGGVFVFYNNPRPFCYTYMIPGDWVVAREPNAYRSKDGRAFAGVLFWLPKNLEGVEGGTLVERARTFVTRQHEKALGQKLAGVELVQFESARPGTWKWTATPVTQGDRLIAFPTKVIVNLSPDAVAQITISGTPDDDGLARRIIESLRTTTDPECYWPVLERMLKSAAGTQAGRSAIRPSSSEDVGTGPELRSFQRVLFELERAYVEHPDFGRIGVGAMQALEDLAAAGAFRVTESEREIGVSYRAAGGERRTITFRRQITREQAVRDLTTLFLLARETDPAVPAPDLERAMIVRALRRLDPDSSFLDPETYRDMQTETARGFGGAGLELTFRGASLTVVAPIEGAPAHRAGVQPGDRLEEIDGLATKGMSLPEVSRRLRGRPGSKVTITISRESWPGPRVFEIAREPIRVMSVLARRLGDGIAYIKLTRFHEETPHDLQRQIEPFARAGMKALILDLRGNGGGLLTPAIEVAEMFLETGKPITYTEGRVRNQNMRFSAHAKKAYTAMPMVTLVDQNTAAGAEIVAGALQDWRRASLLGTHTRGRASIQTIIQLSDGSALNLTTAKWFTPKGRSVHGKGLAPDLAVEGRDAPPVTAATTEEELLARDAQLRSALEHLTRLIAPER